MSQFIKKNCHDYLCPKFELNEGTTAYINAAIANCETNDAALDEAKERFQEKFSMCEQNYIKMPYQKDDIERMKVDLGNKRAEDLYNKIFQQRLKLPAMQSKNIIIDAILQNNVILIIGDTGCGKSTQIPQIILDHYIENGKADECRIVCTQPRRIPTISIAQRVAYEQREKLGCTVGYQIRLQTVCPRGPGSVLYCTTGVLLHKMQTNFLLNEFDIIIIDEVHERGLEVDLLLGLIKKIIEIRNDLKIILMSASVDESCFINYYENCKVIKIEGTMFPVQSFYLEDILRELLEQKISLKNIFKDDNFENWEYKNVIMPHMRNIKISHGQRVADLLLSPDTEGCKSIKFIECLIYYICDHMAPGAILVFLPGLQKITELGSSLRRNYKYKNKIVVYYLHSTLPIATQQLVFNTPNKGIRKIILSTSIAETSVTIDDIVYVIDSGRIKINEYNINSRYNNLTEIWVSKSNVKQRLGRAGRIQPGYCYHLYTRMREDTMCDQLLPEITRTSLHNAILQLKFLRIENIKKFFYNLMDPPFTKAVENGIDFLQEIGCLDEDEKITPLGSRVATIPVEVQLGKMVILGALFKCIDPVTTIAASLSFKSPFEEKELGAYNKLSAKLKLAKDSCSDLLLLHNIVCSARDGINLEEYGLNKTILDDISVMKHQLTTSLLNIGLTDTSDSSNPEYNTNSNNLSIVRSVIAGALYPNITLLLGTRMRKNHVINEQFLETPDYKNVQFCKNSVNFGRGSFKFCFFVYYTLFGITVQDSTMVSHIPLLFFKKLAENISISHDEYTMLICKSLKFKTNKSSYECLGKLKKLFESIVYAKCLGIKFTNDESIIEACCKLFGEHDDKF